MLPKVTPQSGGPERLHLASRPGRGHWRHRKRGHGFLGAIGPIKSAFAERAYLADFDEKLADKIAQLDSAIQRGNTGKMERRGGTAGLDLAVKKLVTIVKELNAIMKTALRTSDPALLAVWKNASRVYSDPVPTPEEESAPTPAAVALAMGANEAASADSNATSAIQPRLNGSDGAVLVA